MAKVELPQSLQILCHTKKNQLFQIVTEQPVWPKNLTGLTSGP